MKMNDANAVRIVAQNITKRFPSRDATGEDVVALQGVNLTVRANEFVTLVGRSGCGKTTFLNIVAGLLRPTEGQILINGRPIDGPGLDRGMVFQHSALFPWLTTLGNIEFGPLNQGVPREQRRRLAKDLIELVRLSGFENNYPHELSGGMQQRVAIARALAMDPETLLMDEPFGALDELTRSEMQSELLRIWEARKKTVLFVTHSITEAIYLSDRIIVLTPHPGRIGKEVTIDMPRDQRQRTSAPFVTYYEEIHSAIF